MKTFKNFTCMWQKFPNPKYAFEAHRSTYSSHNALPHSHDYPQLFYCLQGYYIHTVDGIEYECSEGSLIIVPPGSIHSYICDASITCTLVQINVLLNFFDNFDNDAQLRAITHLFFFQFSKKLSFDPVIHFHFTGLEKKLTNELFTTIASHEWKEHVSNPHQLLKAFCEVFSLSAFALPKKAINSSANFLKKRFIPLLRTIYYINLNYNMKISSEEIVELSGMCRTDYFKYIKQMLGCTYNEYLQSVRLSHAAFLCKFSPYSLSYIANICGFCDLSHMDVAMKKYGIKHPSRIKRERNTNISIHPLMIKSREEYESITPHFHAFGL